MRSPIQTYLDDLYAQLAPLDSGELASYIPELAKADPDAFGICLMTADGASYCVGDADRRFTIQSISKTFVYAVALTDLGNGVAEKVGVEPSGDAFHSISVDPQTGAPLNPMINAGAITSTSLIRGATPQAQWARMERAFEAFMARPVTVDESVCRSESETGHRNRAIAWMLKNSGIIEGDPMAVLENYFRQCSILVSCQDLACMAATLANNGLNPLTGQRVLEPENVQRVMSVMLTCGMYNYAGSWMYEVGLPAKSGVSGGILAVLPGRFGIGVYSPKLDEKGNSVRAIAVCKALSQNFKLHVLATGSHPGAVLGRVYTSAEAPSRRAPPPALRACLAEHAHRIKYFCLHGFIAVDGIEYVIRRMQELAPSTHSFILDMHEVSGISESAALLLNQAIRGFIDDGIATVFSRIRGRASILDPMRSSVRRAERIGTSASRAAGQTRRHSLRRGDRGILSFEDNDLAAEWCENRLYGRPAGEHEADAAFADSPLFAGVGADIVDAVGAATDAALYAAGERIIEAGAEGDGRVFFIESGHVSILVPLETRGHLRIASLGPGMHFGEMVLLGQNRRSASVYAETAVRCRAFKAADFERLSARHPELRIGMLENLARDLAGKLQGANQWIAALA